MSRKRVIITGAGRGIGRAIACRFAREGDRVVLCSRSMHELRAVADEVAQLGGSGTPITMDVSDPHSIRAAIESALDELGGLDVLINNAGIFAVAPLAELELEPWEHMLRVNLTGPLLVTQAALPALLESRGCVLNISSVAGQQGFPGSSAYCASKYGLRGLSDALREEVRDAGVRVATIYPGGTDTTIFDGVPGDWDRSTMNSPEEVAEVVWRASRPGSDQADWNVPPPAG